MAIIKTLRFLNGITTEIDINNDSIAIKSINIGGLSGTELTKIRLDSLVSGFADASNLHSHASLYFNKIEHIEESSGSVDSGKPIKLNQDGKISTSLLESSGRFKKESFTLSLLDITRGYVILSMKPKPESLDLIVAGVVMNEGVDFEIQSTLEQTRLVFLGQLSTLGDAALEVGELIRVKYSI